MKIINRDRIIDIYIICTEIEYMRVNISTIRSIGYTDRTVGVLRMNDIDQLRP